MVNQTKHSAACRLNYNTTLTFIENHANILLYLNTIRLILLFAFHSPAVVSKQSIKILVWK